jgi:hypothetical protein
MIEENHRIDRLCISYVYVDSLSTVVYTLKHTQLCSHSNFQSQFSWWKRGMVTQSSPTPLLQMAHVQMVNDGISYITLHISKL